MDYHTPFLTGELAEDTGIRRDAAARPASAGQRLDRKKLSRGKRHGHGLWAV